MTRVSNHWWRRPGWQPGRRFYTFHFTFDHQPAVQGLAAEVRERLAGFPALDLVPAEWLHLTTQGIGFADEVNRHRPHRHHRSGTPSADHRPPAGITVDAPRAASEGVAP